MPPSSRAVTCPACRRIIAADEPRCPFCGESFGTVFRIDSALHRALGRLDFTKGVVGACILIYALMLALDSMAGVEKAGLGVANPSIGALYIFGLQSTWRIIEAGEWWRLIAAVFLHLSLLHLAMNLAALIFVGPIVEEIYGRARYIVIYVLSGFAASAGSLLFRIDGAGASGAIFGLIGAVAAFGWMRGGTYGAALMRQMLGWAIYGLVFGFLVGANNVAHLCGLGAGAGAGLVLGRGPRWLRTVGNVLAGAASALVAASFIALALAFPSNRRYLDHDTVYEIALAMFTVQEEAAEEAEGAPFPADLDDPLRTLHRLQGPDPRAEAARVAVVTALLAWKAGGGAEAFAAREALRRHLSEFAVWLTEEGPK